MCVWMRMLMSHLAAGCVFFVLQTTAFSCTETKRVATCCVQLLYKDDMSFKLLLLHQFGGLPNMTVNVKLSKLPSKRAASASQQSSSSTPISLALEPATTLAQVYKEAAAKTRVRLFRTLSRWENCMLSCSKPTRRSEMSTA